MVTKQDSSVSKQEAESLLNSAREAIESYSGMEGVNLEKAKAHFRNAEVSFQGLHWRAVVSNSDRTLQAAHASAKEALIKRFEHRSGKVLAEAARLENLFREFHEIRLARLFVKKARERVIEMSAETCVDESSKEFEEAERFFQLLSRAEDAQVQRFEFLTDVRKLWKLIEAADKRYPRGDRRELVKAEALIQTLMEMIEELSVREILDSGFKDFGDTIKTIKFEVEGYLVRMALAFRPRSEKSLKQRDRPRVAKKSSRGPGRHSRR